MLLVSILGIPLLGAAALLRLRNRSASIPFIASSIVLVLGAWGLRGVLGSGDLTFKLSLSGPFTPSLRADALSMIFVLTAAFLWWVVSIYAPAYMKEEGRPSRFAVVSLLTLTAVMGVFLAGDFLTLPFFGGDPTSYFWVVHRWDKEAVRAGYFYLFFSILGGLFGPGACADWLSRRWSAVIGAGPEFAGASTFPIRHSCTGCGIRN